MNDDLWFWVQGILNNVKVRVVDNPNIKLLYIPNSQKVGLYIKNSNNSLFWKEMNNLLSYYPTLKTILINEYYSYQML